ncbi:MAG: hypothetical protein J6C50_02455 [Rickettsiales bacterium]|nr:hypothetical protein [Rickettsiales bacterium]
MTKYQITTFTDLKKIIRIQIIKNKMLYNKSINYKEFYNITKSKNIIDILKLTKKLDVKLFIEE